MTKSKKNLSDPLTFADEYGIIGHKRKGKKEKENENAKRNQRNPGLLRVLPGTNGW